MTNRTLSRQASVKRRIRQFYDLLNQGDFRRCFELIDPQVRVQPRSITYFQYETAGRQFVDYYGPVKIVDISVVLHVNEPSELYKGRDFAVGKTTWEDEAGERHVFSERWVREGRAWFTRSTGFFTPAMQEVAMPVGRGLRSAAMPRKNK